jgi:hypothetical protein
MWMALGLLQHCEGVRMFRFCIAMSGMCMVAGGLSAQSFPRRASIMGGDRGKCTIEVVVDGAAEVEIRGDSAVLRNLRGQAPQWRRFECTQPLPPNPVDFRFAGVDGRGRQELVRDPRNGGVAVVRIEDPDNGREGYTFDIFWAAGGFPPPMVGVGPGPDRRDDDRWYHDRDDWTHGGDNWRNRLFERVRDDLEHVQSVTFPVGADQYRLVRTKQELNELQGQMASGRWDRRQLDDVIGALARVIDDNRLSGRDRDILRDDLNRLRELRDRRR